MKLAQANGHGGSGDTYWSGVTVIEAGTVLKFSTDGPALLNVVDTVDCQTAPDLPAMFASVDDVSVGKHITFGYGNNYSSGKARWCCGSRVAGDRFPKAVPKTNSVPPFSRRQNALLRLQRDAATLLGFVFGPEKRRDDGNGNPAEIDREVVQPFQKVDDGRLAVYEYGQEIIGGGFHQSLVPRSSRGDDLHTSA